MTRAMPWRLSRLRDPLHSYLGHRNIQNTTRYTALAPDRFKKFGGIDQRIIDRFSPHLGLHTLARSDTGFNTLVR
jgi:hypothetical protein